MLRVVLADAELELVPPEVAGHPAVREAARALGKRPSEVLLDQNVHSQASQRLDDGRRRGRPDIVHYTLLTLLESPLCKGGGLEVAVHTRHGELLRIRPDTRLPRGEARFQGLLAKVLRDGASQPGAEPLLSTQGRMAAADVLRRLGAAGPVVRLDEAGPLAAPAQLAELAERGDLTAVLGAFPSGDFSPGWRAAAPRAVSVWPQALNAWAVAAELAAAFRARWGPAAPPAPAGSPARGAAAGAPAGTQA